MNDVGLIGGIIILVILTISVIVAMKKVNDKKALEAFIDGLGDKILEVVLETIADIDPKTCDSFVAFSDLVTQRVYEAVWDYVSYTADEAVEVNKITKAAFKMLDKNMVVKFIQDLYDSRDIYGTIMQDYYKATNISTPEQIEEENTKLEEEYEEYKDQSQYIEDSSEFELPPAEEKEIPEEELEKIIPPSETEVEVIDLDDDSIEIITDKKEIIKTLDKNGKELYYEIDEDGKKSRVSKEYAENINVGENNE